MSADPTLLARAGLATLAALCVTGCSDFGLLQPRPDGAGAAHSPGGEALTPQAAFDRVGVGPSTKAEVEAALGRAIVVSFDSGYAVWVYRWPGADRSTRAATELVLLFDPGGRVAKRRLRPGVASGD